MACPSPTCFTIDPGASTTSSTAARQRSNKLRDAPLRCTALLLDGQPTHVTSIIAQEEDLLGGEHLRSWCTSSRRLFSLIIFADIMASRCRIKAAATGRPLMTSFMKIAKIQQSGDSAVPPAPTSRMSVKHTIEVIQTFNEFK
ncbi:hypothetical protein VPH35_057701 [Triticum aestivum]